MATVVHLGDITLHDGEVLVFVAQAPLLVLHLGDQITNNSDPVVVPS